MTAVRASARFMAQWPVYLGEPAIRLQQIAPIETDLRSPDPRLTPAGPVPVSQLSTLNRPAPVSVSSPPVPPPWRADRPRRVSGEKVRARADSIAAPAPGRSGSL